MLPRCLPVATPYDPAEDPPGSIDPLGTVAAAEQLADILFPGMTARMWRARHLTFAALAAHVADQAAGSSGDDEARLEARLALERLFVSAIARHEANDAQFKSASRRLPGIGLARRAGDQQPLGKRTFLKGQAINGPFGVISRLARHTDVVNDQNRLSQNGEKLLLAWSADHDLPGVLDGGCSKMEGADWVGQLVRRVHGEHLDRWPSNTWPGWKTLAERLRPDRMRRHERNMICSLLADEGVPLRRRCLELLQDRASVSSYRSSVGNGTRGERDREMLFSTFRRLLRPTSSATDRTIDFVIRLIHAYELVASSLDSVMGTVCSVLANRGRATKSDVLRQGGSRFQAIRKALRDKARELQARLDELMEYPDILDRLGLDRLTQLLEDAQAGTSGDAELVEHVMERHTRVQRQKKKGAWIDVDDRHWVLMPGFGNAGNDPSLNEEAYLHPFRVANAYSFLADLKVVPAVEDFDGEEA